MINHGDDRVGLTLRSVEKLAAFTSRVANEANTTLDSLRRHGVTADEGATHIIRIPVSSPDATSQPTSTGYYHGYYQKLNSSNVNTDGELVWVRDAQGGTLPLPTYVVGRRMGDYTSSLPSQRPYYECIAPNSGGSGLRTHNFNDSIVVDPTFDLIFSGWFTVVTPAANVAAVDWIGLAISYLTQTYIHRGIRFTATGGTSLLLTDSPGTDEGILNIYSPPFAIVTGILPVAVSFAGTTYTVYLEKTIHDNCVIGYYSASDPTDLPRFTDQPHVEKLLAYTWIRAGGRAGQQGTIDWYSLDGAKFASWYQITLDASYDLLLPTYRPTKPGQVLRIDSIVTTGVFQSQWDFSGLEGTYSDTAYDVSYDKVRGFFWHKDVWEVRKNVAPFNAAPFSADDAFWDYKTQLDFGILANYSRGTGQQAGGRFRYVKDPVIYGPLTLGGTGMAIGGHLILSAATNNYKCGIRAHNLNEDAIYRVPEDPPTLPDMVLAVKQIDVVPGEDQLEWIERNPHTLLVDVTIDYMGDVYKITKYYEVRDSVTNEFMGDYTETANLPCCGGTTVYRPPATTSPGDPPPVDTLITGNVWDDTEPAGADGIRQGYEPGLRGVIVKLYEMLTFDGSGVPLTWQHIDSDVTTFAGLYQFELQPPGSYFVEVTGLLGYAISPKDVGSDDTVDNDFGVNFFSSTVVHPTLRFVCDPFAATATGGTITRDCGVYRSVFSSSIQGMVFEDFNHNGIMETGEGGHLDFWIVRLYTSNSPTTAQGIRFITSVGSNNGFYQFRGLADGNYIVQVEKKTGWNLSPKDAGAAAVSSHFRVAPSVAWPGDWVSDVVVLGVTPAAVVKNCGVYL